MDTVKERDISLDKLKNRLQNHIGHLNAIKENARRVEALGSSIDEPTAEKASLSAAPEPPMLLWLQDLVDTCDRLSEEICKIQEVAWARLRQE